MYDAPLDIGIRAEDAAGGAGVHKGGGRQNFLDDRADGVDEQARIVHCIQPGVVLRWAIALQHLPSHSVRVIHM